MNVDRPKRDECAVVIDWAAPWDVGAPSPHVIASGNRTYLVYLMPDPASDWDGSQVRVIDPATDERECLAVVEFERCLIHKFGSPNDEVLHGHRLHGRGLVPYQAHIVERSQWLEEVQGINSVHPQYAADRWLNYRHYLLPFHDETFECIATGHRIRTARTTFRDALERCVRAVIEGQIEWPS